MEDLSLWVLIFAGGGIGLLGVFLAASERELKKMRREVETLVARFENSPKIVALDDPVEPHPIDSNAATAAAAKDQELNDRIAYLTSELDTSRKSAEEFRSQRDHLKSEHLEQLELRAINQQLEGEISHLKGELQSAESRVNTARDDGQDATNDRAKLESVIADLETQLETHRVRGEELTAAQQRLADYESRETIQIDEQKNVKEQIRVLQQELFAAEEQARNLQAAHDRVTEMEHLHQEAKNEIRRLEAECSRWQERVGGGEDQKRRGAMLRQQLDELQSKQAALIERHRQFQNDLTAAIRLLEDPPDGLGEASAPRALPMETEACLYPMWSSTGKPVGRNPEQESSAKAGARVEGAMTHADTEALSYGNGENHEIHAESGSSAASTDMTQVTPVIDPSSTMLADRRKRRFGIFPA